MEYGYVRVSTATQSIDRQIVEMKKEGLSDEQIYVDKQSGKDFNRKSYKRLIRKVKEGDLVIIKSIDRLGRNYEMIQDEWKRITKKIKADIKVIDMPILDTRIEGKNLVGKFIGDIVLQVLSFVAQNERENIRQRQAEGIKIAKAKGIHMGRPNYVLPNNFQEVIKKYSKQELTSSEARKALNMSRGTFFKYLKRYRNCIN